MNEPDLFTHADRYPHVAGHRRVDTSVEAANKVDDNKSRKLQCYRDIKEQLKIRGLTTSELADRLPNYSYEYIQPRTTEMFKLGLTQYRGERRKNSRGSTERVWEVV